MQDQTKNIGVCCYFCCKKDLNGATKEYFLNMFVGAFLTVNWILWSSVGKPPHFAPGPPTVGNAFKIFGFVNNLWIMITTAVVFCKWKHDWSQHARGIHLYGKIVHIAIIIQLFFLIGGLCLTSVALGKAGDSPEGIKGLGVFFLISKLVLIGCFCLVCWSLYMTFKLRQLYSPEFVAARERGAGNMSSQATVDTNNGIKEQKAGDKNDRIEMNDSLHEDVTENNNQVMVERDLNRMNEAEGEEKKESQFNQVEVNPINE